jgi:hypothetical protein
MSTETTAASATREPELLGQTVHRDRRQRGNRPRDGPTRATWGADVVLTGRNADRLERAAQELDAQSTAAFDANDAAALKRFFEDLPGSIDHVMVTGPGPRYAPAMLGRAPIRSAWRSPTT